MGLLDGIDTLAEPGIDDRAISADDVPWVPQAENVWFKPLRFDFASGRWINVIRMVGEGVVNRHRHTGGQVIGYCLKGSWRYLERDWVARPGTLIWEPPGDVHTLTLEGSGEMETLFLLEGTVQYLDEDDNLVYQDDVFTKARLYLDHCRQNGIEPKDLRF